MFKRRKYLAIFIVLIPLLYLWTSCNVHLNLNPIIIVKQETTEIGNGSGNYDFGKVLLGASSSARTFIIENVGNTNLYLTGEVRVEISGVNASYFFIGCQPYSPIVKKTNEIFTISFRPSKIGSFTANVTIENNDINSNPFTFTITGTGTDVAPEINVKQGVLDIFFGADPGYDFGIHSRGFLSTEIEFLIQNNGTDYLRLTGNPKVQILEDAQELFKVTKQPLSPVPPNGATNFKISFTPKSVGEKIAKISISNEDSDENPYIFTVRAFVGFSSCIAAGAEHSLALNALGDVFAWGSNTNGVLGDGTTTMRKTPVQVKGIGGVGFLSDIMDIKCGKYHNLALKHDGTVFSWGLNLFGQLGDGTTIERRTPVQVKNETGKKFLGEIIGISAGTFYSLALKSDGTIYAWGLNQSGQLGDNTLQTRNLPVQVHDSDGVGYLSDVVDVTAGATGNHTVALKNNGDVFAWGINDNGQLGNGSSDSNSKLPVRVKGINGSGYLTNIINVAAGENHTLAVSEDGSVFAWGDNESGELGNGELGVSRNPIPVKVLSSNGVDEFTNVTTVTAGERFSVALKDDGTVFAWGSNNNGRLGDKTTFLRNLPVQVKGENGVGVLSNILSIKSGVGHSICFMNNCTILSWGVNLDGRLGDNTTTERHYPVEVVDYSFE